jgi:hypothetical protein
MVCRMLDADHYRQQAAKMREFAAGAETDRLREQFLSLAAEYEKLAERADARGGDGRPSN